MWKWSVVDPRIPPGPAQTRPGREMVTMVEGLEWSVVVPRIPPGKRRFVLEGRVGNGGTSDLTKSTDVEGRRADAGGGGSAGVHARGDVTR